MEMDQIADKIAAEQVGDDSLALLDAAADKMFEALSSMSETVQTVKGETPEEVAAIKKMQDLMETALIPYASDFLDALGVFEGEE